MNKHPTRRHLLQVGVAVALVPAAHTATAQISTATAINRAARFRALSQRCAKAYSQLHLEVMPDSAREVLAAAQRLIQAGFEDLGKAGFASETAQQLVTVRQEATALMAMLGAPANRNTLVATSGQADKMLMAADRLTTLIEGGAKQSSAKLINVAGRQRMLSQRLAKNYFLLAAGVDNKVLRDQLASDRADFNQALSSLQAAPISTSSIRNELALGQSQWMFFESALNRKPDPDVLRNVATTSERLLEVMNNLTVFYEGALKDLLGTS